MTIEQLQDVVAEEGTYKSFLRLEYLQTKIGNPAEQEDEGAYHGKNNAADGAAGYTEYKADYCQQQIQSCKAQGEHASWLCT